MNNPLNFVDPSGYEYDDGGGDEDDCYLPDDVINERYEYRNLTKFEKFFYDIWFHDILNHPGEGFQTRTEVSNFTNNYEYNSDDNGDIGAQSEQMDYEQMDYLNICNENEVNASIGSIIDNGKYLDVEFWDYETNSPSIYRGPVYFDGDDVQKDPNYYCGLQNGDVLLLGTMNDQFGNSYADIPVSPRRQIIQDSKTFKFDTERIYFKVHYNMDTPQNDLFIWGSIPKSFTSPACPSIKIFLPRL